MAKKTSPDEMLDWTVSEDGFDDEAAAPVPAQPAPKEDKTAHRPRRWQVVLLLGAPMIVVLAGVWTAQNWDNGQTRREIERIIQPGGLAPFLPVGVLQPITDTARLHELTVFSSNRVRAEVEYAFTAPDGSLLHFAVPWFFQRVEGLWKRSDTVDSFPNVTRTHTGPHLTLTYRITDEAFIDQTLAPYLADLLTRACRAWECAEDTRVVIDFTADVAPSPKSSQPQFAPDAPLLFALLQHNQLPTSPDPLKLAPLFRSGTPTDPASVEWHKRAVGLQALVALTHQPGVLGESAPSERNALFYALLARQGAHLGLEPAPVLHLKAPENGFDLMSIREPFSISAWSVRAEQRQRTLQGALGLLNELLKDEPPQTENRLLRTLPYSSEDGWSDIVWLIGHLAERGIPPDDVFRRLQAASRPDGENLMVIPPRGEFVLNCGESGPLMFTKNGLQPILPLKNFPIFAWASDWSPDGQRLALNFYLFTLMIDWESGQTHWAPDTTSEQATFAAGWTSDTVLAYQRFAFPKPGAELDPSDVTLEFFDFRQPASAPIRFAEAWANNPFPPQPVPSVSPDRRWALISPAPPFDLGQPRPLTLLSLADGARTDIGQSVFAAWSPDSRTVAYAVYGEGNSSTVQLKLFDVARRSSRIVSPDATWETYFTYRGRAYVELAWSPTGSQIAYLIGTSAAPAATRWLGLIRPDGSRPVRLAETSQPIGSISFSPDGKYLAATFPADSVPSLILYDTTTGKIVRTLMGRWHKVQWAPTGQSVLLFSEQTVSKLAKPLDPQSQPEKMRNENCQNVVWNPKP